MNWNPKLSNAITPKDLTPFTARFPRPSWIREQKVKRETLREPQLLCGTLSFRFAPNHVSGKCGAQHSFIKLITVFQVQSEMAKFRFTIFHWGFLPPPPALSYMRFLWGNCNCNAVICHRFAFWFLNGCVWFWITAAKPTPMPRHRPHPHPPRIVFYILIIFRLFIQDSHTHSPLRARTPHH